MSSVSAISLSGLNAAQQRLAVSARNIARLPAISPIQPITGYGPDPQDSVEVVGQRAPGKAPAPSYSPQGKAPSAPVQPPADLETNVVGLLVAQYAFIANAKVLAAQNKTEKSLIDVLA